MVKEITGQIKGNGKKLHIKGKNKYRNKSK